MALPKDYHWRKGDQVSIAGTIGYDYDPSDSKIWVNVGDELVILHGDSEAVSLVSPRLEIGDDVTDGSVSGEIVGLHDTYGSSSALAVSQSAPASTI